ncbi:MAG TPA: protein kinase [Polyangiales bacterium]|nr:protein kinase [Polyangiales bacterium]
MSAKATLDQGPGETEIAAGVLVGARFLVESAGAASALGQTFLARDQKTKKPIAVFVLCQALAEDRAAVEIFRSEARNAAKLKHRNLLAIYGVGAHAGRQHFIAQEWLAGQTAAELIAERKNEARMLSVRGVYNLIAHVCKALSAIHEVSIHGALRPEVVWVSKSGRVKLGELGAAATLARTRRWELLGPEEQAFLAPEVRSGAPADKRSDVFGVGALLYGLLTARSPIESFVAPSQARDDVGTELDALLMRCLASDPEQRFSTPDEVVQALLPLCADAPEPSTPDFEMEVEVDVDVAHSLAPRPRASAAPARDASLPPIEIAFGPSASMAPEPPRSAGDRWIAEGSRPIGASLPAVSVPPLDIAISTSPGVSIPPIDVAISTSLQAPAPAVAPQPPAAGPRIPLPAALGAMAAPPPSAAGPAVKPRPISKPLAPAPAASPGLPLGGPPMAAAPKAAAAPNLAEITARLTQNDAPRWMAVKDGMDHGPFTARELIKLIVDGEILERHLLFTLSSAERKPLAEYPEFADFVHQYKLRKEEKDYGEALERSTKIEKRSTAAKALILAASIGAILVVGLGYVLSRRAAEQSAHKAELDLAALYESGQVKVSGTAGILQHTPRTGGGRRGSGSPGKGGGNTGTGFSSYEDAMNQAMELDMGKGGGERQLTSSDVAGVMNRNLNRMFSCVGEELRQGGKLSRVTIDLAIVGSGRVLGASVNAGGAGFQKCIVAKLREVQFPSFPAPRMGARYSFNVD